jgi:hypothetical protein
VEAEDEGFMEKAGTLRNAGFYAIAVRGVRRIRFRKLLTESSRSLLAAYTTTTLISTGTFPLIAFEYGQSP